MSTSGDENQPECDPSVTEAFRQIADIYVEASRELTESDPDRCLDIPEQPLRPVGAARWSGALLRGRR